MNTNQGMTSAQQGVASNEDVTDVLKEILAEQKAGFARLHADLTTIAARLSQLVVANEKRRGI